MPNVGYVNYQSGWCFSCGRRRGADGRCANCDPWWTSPLIQVGGPMLGVMSVLLVVLAASFTPLRPDPAAATTQHFTPLTTPLLAAPAPVAPSSSFGPLSPPAMSTATAFSAPPPLPPSAFLPPPDPEQLQFERLEELRFQVRSASASMRAYHQWSPSYGTMRPTSTYSSSAQMAPAF